MRTASSRPCSSPTSTETCPHPALRATFSRKREKGSRPLSRLRERVGVRVRRNARDGTGHRQRTLSRCAICGDRARSDAHLRADERAQFRARADVRARRLRHLPSLRPDEAAVRRRAPRLRADARGSRRPRRALPLPNRDQAQRARGEHDAARRRRRLFPRRGDPPPVRREAARRAQDRERHLLLGQPHFALGPHRRRGARHSLHRRLHRNDAVHQARPRDARARAGPGRGAAHGACRSNSIR